MTEILNGQVNVIKDFNLSTLDEKGQQEAVNSIVTLLQDRVMTEVVELLSIDEQKELAALMEAGDTKKAMEYVVKHVPGLDAITYREYQAMNSEALMQRELVKEGLEDYQKEMQNKLSASQNN